MSLIKLLVTIFFYGFFMWKNFTIYQGIQMTKNTSLDNLMANNDHKNRNVYNS